MTPCVVRLVAARCGRLSVPEDWQHPGGHRISLRIAVIPAARQPAVGALFFLDGGPGGAASSELPAFDQLFGDIASSRDVVFVDQRGTGGSHPLRCPRKQVSIDAIAAVTAYVRSCFARIGAEARFYTTVPAMHDIEAVRRAFGYGRIDLFGGSYGATAAQIYLRLYPRSVRSLVLDGASLLGVHVYEVSARNAQRALDTELARCVATPSCARAFTGTREELDQLLARGPRNTVAYGRKVTLDSDSVAATVRALSLDAGGAALLPAIIHLAARGDYTALARQYVDWVGSNFDARLQLVMAMEIQCSEPWARFAPVAVERAVKAAISRTSRGHGRHCSHEPAGTSRAASSRGAPSS